MSTPGEKLHAMMGAESTEPRYTDRVHEESFGPRRYFYDNGVIMRTEAVLAALNDGARLRATLIKIAGFREMLEAEGEVIGDACPVCHSMQVPHLRLGGYGECPIGLAAAAVAPEVVS